MPSATRRGLRLAGPCSARPARSRLSPGAATRPRVSSPQGRLEIKLQLQQVLQIYLSSIVDNVPGGEVCQGANGSGRRVRMRPQTRQNAGLVTPCTLGLYHRGGHRGLTR